MTSQPVVYRPCKRCFQTFTPLYRFEDYCLACWKTEKRIKDWVKLYEEIDQWKRENEWMKREDEEME